MGGTGTMPNVKREARHKTSRERLRDIELNNLAEEFADAMKNANLKYVAAGGMTTLRMQEIWGRYKVLAIEYGDLEA